MTRAIWPHTAFLAAMLRGVFGGEPEELRGVVVEDVLLFLDDQEIEAIDAIDRQPDRLGPAHLIAAEHHAIQEPPSFCFPEEGLEHLAGVSPSYCPALWAGAIAGISVSAMRRLFMIAPRQTDMCSTSACMSGAIPFCGQMHGMDGGTTGIDDEFAARNSETIGAWILGRNMFGPFEGVDLRALGFECAQFLGSEKATHVVLRRQG